MVVLWIQIGAGGAVDQDRGWLCCGSGLPLVWCCGTGSGMVVLWIQMGDGSAMDPDRGWWCCGSGWVMVVL